MKGIKYGKISVFYVPPGDKGGGDILPKKELSDKKGEATTKKEVIEKKEGGLFGDLPTVLKEAYNEISEAQNSKIQAVKETYKILVATGALATDISSIPSLARRWFDGSGKSGIQAVVKALKDAKDGHISIVTYANNEYKTHPLRDYEKLVRANTSQLNVGIVKGLIHLYKVSPSLSFNETTWAEIGTYCASRQWKTQLINGDTETETFMKKYYEDKKRIEEVQLQSIITEELKGIERSDPRLAALLSENNLEYTEKGTISAEKAIISSEIKNALDVPELFAKLKNKFLLQSKELSGRAAELLKTSKAKCFSDLNLSLGGNQDKVEFNRLTWNDAQKGLILIKKHLLEIQQKNPKDPQIGELKKIITILTEVQGSRKAAANAADANKKEIISRSANDDAKKSGKPLPTVQELIKVLDSDDSQQKVIASRNAAVARVETEIAQDYLKQFQINDISSAQKELKKLSELGRPLTKDEESLRAGIIAFIDSKKREAQVYASSKILLGEKEAQTIFIESNHFITGNTRETYDFKIIEKTAILTDMESSPGERNLARMKPGDILNMSQIIEGEKAVGITSAPEIS